MASTITAEGALTCGNLLATVGMADKLWADNASKKFYDANVEVIRAIRENQSVQFPQLQTDKWNQLKLMWLEMCEDDTVACTDLCDAGTPDDMSSGCSTYELACLAEAHFRVAEYSYDFTYFGYQEAIAKAMLLKMKILDEKIAQLGVAALSSYTGVNKFTTGIFEGTDNLFIAPPYWGPDLMGQLSMAAIMNKFRNPYLISGTNLYTANWNAEMNAGNADGKGAQKKMGSFPAYFDLFNVDSIAGKVTYLVDPNALAFVNKARYSTTPREYGNGADKTVYSIESKNLPGVFYDVIYFTSCSGDEIYHNFKLKATGAFLQNPTGCDTDITGVLEFQCGNPES
jgi:hypothetical protein